MTDHVRHSTAKRENSEDKNVKKRGPWEPTNRTLAPHEGSLSQRGPGGRACGRGPRPSKLARSGVHTRFLRACNNYDGAVAKQRIFSVMFRAAGQRPDAGLAG